MKCAIVATAVFGCGGLAQVSDDGTCIEGRQIPCACDGGAGVATCGSDGGFASCWCGKVDENVPPPPVEASVDAPPPLPPFDIENPKECLANDKENVLYVVAEAGAGGYPVFPESPNPALVKVMLFTMKISPDGDRAVQFFLEPSGYKYGFSQEYLFSLRNLHVPLASGVIYEDTIEPSDFTTPKPIQRVFGLCPNGSNPTGRFVFQQLEYTPALKPTRFTVAFERRCGPFKPALRGCVHYDQANP